MGPIMTKPKIAIMLSTPRAARFGHKAGERRTNAPKVARAATVNRAAE